MTAAAVYFKDIFIGLWTVLVGMRITAKHLFTPSVTIQYPKEKKELPAFARNQLFNKIEDCIGCSKCAIVCPVDCIYIDTIKANRDEDLGKASTGHNKRLWVTRFDIDMAKCCFCGLCTEPCPTECLTMTSEYEYAGYDRDNLIFKFSDLTPSDIERLKNTREKPEPKKPIPPAAAPSTPAKEGGA